MNDHILAELNRLQPTERKSTVKPNVTVDVLIGLAPQLSDQHAARVEQIQSILRKLPDREAATVRILDALNHESTDEGFYPATTEGRHQQATFWQTRDQLRRQMSIDEIEALSSVIDVLS